MAQLLTVTFMLLAQLLASRHQAVKTTGTAAVDVRAAAITLTSVTLMPPEQIVSAGGSVFLEAIGTFSNGTTGDVTNAVLWTVSSGATLITPGQVLVPSVTTVTVFASFGGLVANATVVGR